MAETKKTTVNVTPAAKAVASQVADTKTEEVKAAPAASAAAKKEEPKKAEKKTPGRKPAAKKTAAKKAPAKKEAAAKKTAAKTTTKAAKAPAKKTALKVTLHLEYKGQSRTTDDLVKTAKDVWKYDMKQKLGDFKAVELYVKPEENKVYFVVNGDMTGSFDL